MIAHSFSKPTLRCFPFRFTALCRLRCYQYYFVERATVMHTHCCLQSLYALGRLSRLSASGCRLRHSGTSDIAPVSDNNGQRIQHSLKVILAHGPIATVAVETFDAAICCFLAWVKELAVSLPATMSAMEHEDDLGQPSIRDQPFSH